MSSTVTRNAVAEVFEKKCNTHLIKLRNKPTVHHLVYKSPLCLGPHHLEFEILNVLGHAIHCFTDNSSRHIAGEAKAAPSGYCTNVLTIRRVR